MDELKDIKTGIAASEVLKKHNLIKERYDDLVLSIQFAKRSLDLKADDPKIVEQWVKYFDNFLQKRRKMRIKSLGS